MDIWEVGKKVEGLEPSSVQEILLGLTEIVHDLVNRLDSLERKVDEMELRSRGWAPFDES